MFAFPVELVQLEQLSVPLSRSTARLLLWPLRIQVTLQLGERTPPPAELRTDSPSNPEMCARALDDLAEDHLGDERWSFLVL